MAQQPLNESELRIVRGMIDEYRYQQENRLHRRRTITTGQIALGVVCAVVLLTMQIVTLIDTARGW